MIPDWLTGSILHDAADRVDDSHDHDELHAAATVLASDPIWASTTPYVTRWLEGLSLLHEGVIHEARMAERPDAGRDRSTSS